jgi:hypothetical protein
MSFTEDEIWFVSESQHSTKWSVAGDETSTGMSQTIGMKNVKLMLTVIWELTDFSSPM